MDSPAAPLLDVQGLVKSFGALRASDGISLDVRAGEIHAVIGPNGAGKTTLINQLSGEMAPDGGQILFDGMNVTAMDVARRARMGLARSYQITSIFPEFTALENLAMAVQSGLGHHFRFWRNAKTDPARIAPAMEGLRRVELEAVAHSMAGELAHGQQRQLELAMALATGPKLLLLDEPMAGMGPEESRRMTDILLPLKGRVSILLVEHDMDVVFALADRITVLVLGKPIATDTPARIRANPDVRAAYLGESP
ncbi:MAG: ABC transporter ATP-binding protein [Rhodospirillales bacterium]|nr:ABC transporter ATP-binding protein [Rhodospirillales bacterium]